MHAFTVAERPDLTDPAWERTSDVFPEYNNHGDVLNRYWGRLIEELPDFQFHIVADDGEILARARTIPLRARDHDPAGSSGPRDQHLCAASDARHRAPARVRSVIAPVRPNLKDRYPLVPIDRYAAWRRKDGSLFDPWLRIHERLGATVIKPEPESLRITGTVADWESWTEMAFPESGDYPFPGGLAQVTIDRDADAGSYWEPNVWMRHDV